MSKRLGLWPAILLVIVAAMALASCTSAAPPTTSAPATEAPSVTEAPTAEPTTAPTAEVTQAPPTESVTFNFTQEFGSLNPLYTTMYFETITFQLWNCWAWDFDENNNPRPLLVTEIPSTDNGGMSEDGLTLTMKLRDDIKWSDGEPITADDFVFTYKMTVDDGNTVSSQYPYDSDHISAVEAPDPQTVVVTFTQPFGPWLATLWHGLLPAHVLQPVFDADGTLDNAEWNLAPTVGCGPFTFAEWSPGQSARFVADPNYWLGQPKIGEIIVTFNTDNDAQRAAVLSGDSDLGSFLDFSELPEYKNGGINIYQGNSGYHEGIYFRVDGKSNPAMTDVKVRQAIAYAIDKDAIVNDLLGGATGVPATFWGKSPYADPSLKPYPYDPEKAKSLLDEADWKDTNGDGTRDKDGVELVLKYATNQRELRKRVQAVVQQQLQEVGIGTELQNYDSDVFFASYGDDGPVAKGEADIFELSNATSFPDPDTQIFLCSEVPSDEKPEGTNSEAICDEELDALFAQQLTQADVAARTETFQQITKMTYDKMYWLGFWDDPDLWAVSPRIKNVKFSGVTPFFNIIEWEAEPK